MSVRSAKAEALEALGEIDRLVKDPTKLSTVQQVILRSLVTHATERVLAIAELTRVRRKTEGDQWVCSKCRRINALSSPLCEECGEPGPGTPALG